MNIKEKLQEAEEGLRGPSSKVFLSTKDICGLLGVTRYALYSAVKKGALPKPIKLSKRTFRWKASDVYAWADRAAGE